MVAGLGLRGECMGVDSADIDGDGFFDIYWTNYNENFLWKSNGGRTFREVGKRAGVADPFVGWGTGFVDFDNDGLLDIYGVNGLIGPSKEMMSDPYGQPLAEPNFLYRGNGDGTYTDVTDLAGFGDAGVARGVAIGDYDNDGDLDLFVVNADGTDILYRNEIGNRNNWLKLRFEGSQSNRGGVGVKLHVITKEWRQTLEIKSGAGYLSGNGPECLVGLGDLSEAPGLVVLWPSGVVQTLRDVPVNQTITIRETETGG
jgi:hypothetical protein